jgi:hypothetical protein
VVAIMIIATLGTILALDGVFYAWTGQRATWTIDRFPTTVDLGVQMRLFRRKRSDEEAARCPRCGEPVPEGALECMMCGVALEPLREVPSDEEAKSPQTDRPAR